MPMTKATGMIKITTALAQRPIAIAEALPAYADKGTLLLDSALPAHGTITVGNDAALSTSECIYYTNPAPSRYIFTGRFGSLLCCVVV